MDNNSLNDTQKEALALTTMRTMLQIYAEQHKISFEEALSLFAMSRAYSALFDFDTEIWKEGPIYLMEIFKESLALANRCQTTCV